MKNRRVEYLSASIMLGWAAILALPGDTIQENDAFSSFIERGWTETELAAILGVAGALWMGALWVNGHHRRSPVVRCLGAGAGCMMWSHIAVLLVTHAWAIGVASTGIAAYGVLAVFDLISCYRSAADAYDAHVLGKLKDSLAGRGNDG
jgi:hypothetical protein